jgi:hypothetical protein
MSKYQVTIAVGSDHHEFAAECECRDEAARAGSAAWAERAGGDHALLRKDHDDYGEGRTYQVMHRTRQGLVGGQLFGVSVV